MEEKIKIIMQNSDTVLPKGKRDILAFPSPLLVPCIVTENADDFEVEYDTAGLVSCEKIKNERTQDKYRFLYNCAALIKLVSEFSSSLAPNNVYMDVNLLPKLLKRDSGSMENDDFLAQYKALIASVIVPRYSFEDYYNGGRDLFRKNKWLKKLRDMDTVDAVADTLMKQYQIEVADASKHKTTVGKRRFLFYRIALPVLTIVTVGCIALGVYLNFIKLPFEEQLIHGSNAYLSSDYLGVQDELSGITVANMPYESKYVLARSYVVSESLNSSQKENILAMLTMQTDDVYFDYWIELGRLNFENAIDVAQRIGDDQLLLLAYMKYESFLETDTSTMTGDEKAQKLSDLKSKIESLSTELEKARGEADGSTDGSLLEETVTGTEETVTGTEETVTGTEGTDTVTEDTSAEADSEVITEP